MSINLSYSSEMMSQYIQGETIGPGQKFEALQSLDGHSLLFSISTNGIFYLIEEQPSLETGWQQNDLSSVLQTQFSSTLRVKDFSIAQIPNSSDFGVLLAITVDEVDYLYYSNSYTRNTEDNSITLEWTALPFDADNPPSILNINQVYYSNNNEQSVGVVDIVSEQDGDILRYYIDPQKKAASKYWTPYLLPYDMDAKEAHYICDGKRVGAKINGLYTLGTVGSDAIVVFQEFFDYYGSGAAPSTRLLLPTGIQAQNLASIFSVDTAPDKDGSYTDLFVTGSDGGLYYYAANQQSDQQEGVLLFKNDLFKEVNTLAAYQSNDKVVVWGLNRAQQVFYTQVNLSEVQTGSQWSLPLPIATQVEQISPYTNRVNGGNTYFAHTGNSQLKKAFQDPLSTLWTKQDIVVPALPNSTAQKFDAYTTKISLTDESNLPITGVSLQVSSSYRTAVYINYHYYVLDTTPIAVPVDSQGSLYILQRTNSLQAALLTIQSPDGNQSLTINPMDKVADTYLTLTTPEALQEATVTDDKGQNPQPLLPSTTSDDDIQATADAMQSLSDAYSSLNGNNTNNSSATAVSLRVSPHTRLHIVDSIGETMDDFADAIEVAAGDLLDCITNATEYVIHIVKDAAAEVWNFVCEIGEAVLTFVIDTIEKVVAALQAVLEAIAIAVKLAIQFIKFLFSWDDIQLTKDVFKNMLLVTFQGALDSVDTIKDGVDGLIEELQNTINEWADLPDSSSGSSLQDLAANSDNSSSNSASSDFLQYYFTNNATSASMTLPNDVANNPQFAASIEQLQATATQWLNQQEGAETQPIKDAFNTFYEQILKDDQYKSMSLVELIQKSIAIFLDALLGVAEEIFDLILDLVKEIASSVLQFLDTPIWIPVLSDILEEFFDTAISFSILDVILLVVALPATLGCKILTGQAPFVADTDYTNTLLNAQNFQTLFQAVTGHTLTAPTSMLVLATTPSTQTPSDKQILLFVVGRLCTSITSILAAFLVIPSALAPNSKILTAINIILTVVAVIINALVNILAQPAPLLNDFCNNLYYSLILLNIMFKGIVVYCIWAGSTYAMKITAIKLFNDISTFIIKGINLVTVGMHLYELIRDFDDYPEQASLAIAECGVDITDFLTRFVELVMVATPSKAAAEIEAVEVGIDVGLYALQSLLQIGQSAVAGITLLVDND